MGIYKTDPIEPPKSQTDFYPEIPLNTEEALALANDFEIQLVPFKEIDTASITQQYEIKWKLVSREPIRVKMVSAACKELIRLYEDAEENMSEWKKII